MDQRNVSRREILRRGASVGGMLLWVAPAVQSLKVPSAHAQAASPLETCFTAKFEEDGSCSQVDGVGSDRCGIVPLADGCGRGVTVSIVPGGDWTVTLPSGCRFVAGGSKCDGPEVPCEPARDNGDGTVTFFRCPKRDGSGFHDISNISLEFCCS